MASVYEWGQLTMSVNASCNDATAARKMIQEKVAKDTRAKVPIRIGETILTAPAYKHHSKGGYAC
jgi:hypothetical protein